MKTLQDIYDNKIGKSYKVIDDIIGYEKISLVMNEISLFLSEKELNQFINSTKKILNYHDTCSCSKDLKNKMVVYQAKETEIRMTLSYNEISLLNDLLKGTQFRLSMDFILNKYKLM